MKKLEIAPADSTIDAIIASEDCVSLSILNSILIGNKQIVDFANKIIKSGDNYYIDTYWLLLYQLFRDGDIKNAYGNIKIFDTLLKYDVNFIPGETHTQAEHECAGINASFIFGPIGDFLEKIKK